jgi:hypothetical protein
VDDLGIGWRWCWGDAKGLAAAVVVSEFLSLLGVISRRGSVI